MRTLARLVVLAVLLLGSSPVVAWAHDKPGVARPHHRSPRPHHRPHHVFPCCFGGFPAPPVLVAPPPVYVPTYVVVPTPPDLVHVPTPRTEPAPEVTLPTGRWARHGNGVDYPYTWVWVGPAPAAP
jgi:hypothetical protein